MSGPLRFTCNRESDIPQGEELVVLVTRERHLVLRFPARPDGSSALPDKRAVVASIAAALPENYSVFDSGGGADGSQQITVMQVISREEVLQNEEAILEAARLFRHTARDLAHRLAGTLGVEVSRFWTTLVRQDVPETGDVDADWGYWFHGLECCFRSKRTGQNLDVLLGFVDEFGVLDPYFFAAFIRSTPEPAALAGLFLDDFHDPRRALAILETRERLVRVGRWLEQGSGVFAPD